MKSNSILLVAAVVLSLPLAAQAQLPSSAAGQVAPQGTVPAVTWEAAPISYADPSCVDGVSCTDLIDPTCTGRSPVLATTSTVTGAPAFNSRSPAAAKISPGIIALPYLIGW